MRALWRASIWHPDAPSMQKVQTRFRPVFRIGLPVFDVALIAFSVFGIVFGSRAVEEFTLWWFTPLLAGAIGVASAAALGGLVFQKPKIELTSKFVLGVCIAVYVVFLIASATVRSASAALTAALAIAVLTILALRVFDLIDQAAQEEDAA
ncbi:MAG: hypothetical protein K0S37_1981 [Microbacterium sp.]|jgi:hypothetical protein|nr:hypothetical protein [Microbacterium sp.]